MFKKCLFWSRNFLSGLYEKPSAFSLIFCLSLLSGTACLAAPANVIGKILLQVEANGEAWYVYPQDQQRYYLGRPTDAFEIMKKLSLGATHSFIMNTEIFPSRLLGMILLDVEANGEAYYIYPGDAKKYYLGRPADAFAIMREKGLGITNADLFNIPVGDAYQERDRAQGVAQNVPFSPQAPFGNWGDQRQEDGCEEASALMAVRWANGQGLTREEALSEILAISDFEQEKYGEYRDISVEDTIDWIFKDYFNYGKVQLKNVLTVDDIIEELNNGNIVVVPMDGQLLYNPYFTPPGPERHMILIKGYDPATKMFITNDPGTKRGESYNYSAQTIYNAILHYSTGYHEPVIRTEKVMIVVLK